MILPQEMVSHERVSIYSDSKGRIAFEFCDDGDYVVRRTSATSRTMRVAIPRSLVGGLLIGLHDISLQRNADGWLILDPQTLA